MTKRHDGTKGIKVGARIAVLAEPGDDLQTLEMPEEESMTTKQEEKSGQETSTPLKKSSSASESKKESPRTGAETDIAQTVPGQAQKQTYPLYPSVIQMLHERGVPLSDADKIPATGPRGRLLKGDVLAYLGAIKASYPSEQSQRLSRLGHLDLDNIKVAAAPTAPAGTERQIRNIPIAEGEAETEIAVAVSFKAVREVQQRIQKSLGIDVPLKTFVSRAVEISNSDLPPVKRAPTTDEMFNEILGLDHVNTSTSQRAFIPQMLALPGTSRTPQSPISKEADIIDILTGAPSTLPIPSPPRALSRPNAQNVFSLNVGKADEKRARVFLERVKTILQVDPGRLVL